MKKIFAFLFFISALCGFAFAQSSFPEIEITREIKLLKSTVSDVRAIMAEFDRDEDDDEEDEYYVRTFRSDKATVKVSFSTGDCSEEAGIENQPEWNVPKMTATKVVITFDEDPKLKDLGLNLAGFKKKLEDEEIEDSEQYIYYDENAGIIIQTDEGEVEKIILHPPRKQIGYLCSNENNEEILSGEMSFIDAIVEKDTYCILRNMPSNVSNLELRANGVFGCQDEKCLNAKKEIRVTTTASDAEGDTLVYHYTVSGGKINGSGYEVIWDLMGVEPGIYTITAGTDDGVGVVGQTQSRKILVKENSYEIIPQPTPKIKELILDKTELVAACPVGKLRRVRCASGNCGISVTSAASEGKNLTYKYIADGEVIGNGEKVIWDLANLKPGEYEIEVSASDDGMIFGEPKTATVVIKENPACTLPKK